MVSALGNAASFLKLGCECVPEALVKTPTTPSFPFLSPGHPSFPSLAPRPSPLRQGSTAREKAVSFKRFFDTREQNVCDVLNGCHVPRRPSTHSFCHNSDLHFASRCPHSTQHLPHTSPHHWHHSPSPSPRAPVLYSPPRRTYLVTLSFTLPAGRGAGELPGVVHSPISPPVIPAVAVAYVGGG